MDRSRTLFKFNSAVLLWYEDVTELSNLFIGLYGPFFALAPTLITRVVLWSQLMHENIFYLE